MLVGQVVKRVEHPSEPGQWMEFRKLPWRKLEEAQRAVQIDGVPLVKAYGPELIREIRRVAQDGVSAELAAAVEAEKAARRQRYDTGTLLRAGIVKWSYSEGRPTPDQVEDLDTETAEWAREQILALSVPEPRTEAEQKND